MSKKENYTQGDATIDFLCLVAIFLLLAAIFGVFLSLIGKRSGSPEQELIYTVRIAGIEDSIADGILVGDKVLDSPTKRHIGTVVKIDRETSCTKVLNAEGNGIRHEAIEGLSDLVITVSADCTEDEDGIYVSGCPLRIGRRMYIRLPYFTGEGFCIGIVGADGETP